MQDVDGFVFGFASGLFLVHARVGFGFLHFEVTAGLERTFFDHDDFEPGVGEDFGRHTATRAGADDGHIGFELEVTVERGAIAGIPATGDSGANDILSHGFPLYVFSSGGPG